MITLLTYGGLGPGRVYGWPDSVLSRKCKAPGLGRKGQGLSAAERSFVLCRVSRTVSGLPDRGPGARPRGGARFGSVPLYGGPGRIIECPGGLAAGFLLGPNPSPGGVASGASASSGASSRSGGGCLCRILPVIGGSFLFFTFQPTRKDSPKSHCPTPDIGKNQASPPRVA